MTLTELQRRALEMTKPADFGPEAIRVNAEIVSQAPNDAGAWTRLGRCHLEQRTSMRRSPLSARRSA
jgi:hypothetical protein